MASTAYGGGGMYGSGVLSIDYSQYFVLSIHPYLETGIIPASGYIVPQFNKHKVVTYGITGIVLSASAPVSTPTPTPTPTMSELARQLVNKEFKLGEKDND